MTTEDEMTVDERRKYLRKIKERYARAHRKARGQLLDEMGTVTGLHRKSLIRLLNRSLERNPRRKQRSRTYGLEVDDALQVIAESFDYLCAERLTPNLVWMATHLTAHGELEVSPPLLGKLGRISVSTVGRILARIRQDQPRLPRKGPGGGHRASRDIPMKRIAWNEQQPGHFEVDLVHHCGPSASGEYLHTIQMIDVATGWSERVAVLGRSYVVMEDGFRHILARLPFPILELHPDNGSEFFNDHLLRFWKDIVHDVQLSRSRPYRKNDNRFVEQKNATLVRAYLGYDRLDSITQTNAINQLYDKMWLYYNFFQPVMRLTEKTSLSADGQPSQIKRRFDQARTPFDRLCETDVFSEEQKDQFRTLRDQVNPRQLRQEIYDLINHIFRLPGAVPGKTEDIYKTLSTPIQSRKGEGIPVTLSFEPITSVR